MKNKNHHNECIEINFVVIILFLFIFLISTKVFSSVKDSLNYNKQISINASMLCFGELSLGYEKFIFKNHPRLSLNTELGLKVIHKSESYHNLEKDFYADLFAYFWANSLYVSSGIRNYNVNIYFLPKPNYFEISPFYRVDYFNKEMVYYDQNYESIHIRHEILQTSVNQSL